MNLFVAAAVTPVITSDMLQPLVDGVSANLGVIIPIGVGLLALFIGISLIPKLIKKFTKG